LDHTQQGDELVVVDGIKIQWIAFTF